MLIVHWAATGCHFAPIVATVTVVIITTSIFYFLRVGSHVPQIGFQLAM